MSLDAAQSQKNNPQAASGVMNQVMGRRWMVAAGHPLAAQAAARILEAGGNAIDAGAAAGMMLGVVHPDMVSFAGVGPLLVHVAKSKKTYEVSGVGPYPRLASAEYYRTQCGGEIPVGLDGVPSRAIKPEPQNDVAHVQNLCDCIRGGGKPRSRKTSFNRWFTSNAGSFRAQRCLANSGKVTRRLLASGWPAAAMRTQSSSKRCS